jgi:DNA-binding MarR family transcriptional regulator
MHLCRCIVGAMDGVRLHRLGKRLIDLARAVTTESGDPALTACEVAVLEDVFRYVDSPVSDIQARTGFAQSHVSVSVARLAERGLVHTAPDPADRRRTLVRLADPARRAIVRRAVRPADSAIAEAIPDPDRAHRVTLLLDELADLLLD